jgi:hypothetical protein
MDGRRARGMGAPLPGGRRPRGADFDRTIRALSGQQGAPLDAAEITLSNTETGFSRGPQLDGIVLRRRSALPLSVAVRHIGTAPRPGKEY